MPRLSLYKPEKGNDYRFLDKQITEMFTVGGTDVFVHKYLGPKNPDEASATADQPQYDAVKETNIQDMLFMENRDRKYDPDIYTMRGIYSVSDVDFDMSQFGLFLQNDIIFMTIPINASVKTLGRKIMSGDVIELPHLKDENALNDYSVALKRFYVVEDVNRASEGFSQTWYPHLYRIKMKQILDSQEFKEILDLPAQEGSTQSLRDVLSTYEKEMQVNDAIISQAEADAPKSGFNFKQYYVTPIDERGNVRLDSVNSDQSVSSDAPINAEVDTPATSHYGFRIGGDGVPPNGHPAGFGTSFPSTNVNSGDYFLRTDYLPNRLFRYDGVRWIKVEDAVRLTTTNDSARGNFKSQFINQSGTKTINGLTTEQRQSLTDALKPKADN